MGMGPCRPSIHRTYLSSTSAPGGPFLVPHSMAALGKHVLSRLRFKFTYRLRIQRKNPEK